MTRFTRSLRFRVAMAFATLGGVLSLLMALGLYFGAVRAGVSLVDETLYAELQAYVLRRALNPGSQPPIAATLFGYVKPAAGPAEPRPRPAAVAALPNGNHDVQLNGIPYRVIVADHPDARYYLLYNQTQFERTQRALQQSLAGFVALMALLCGAIAFRLADRVIEPVKLLAQRVRAVEPGSYPTPFGTEFSDDEVGELARAFENTLTRLADFIERERAFTGNVSHELRTPIAIIRGASEVLLADESRPLKDRQRLQRIERAATDMADISTALLAMARERDDELHARVDLAVLIEEIVEKHRYLLAQRPIQLRFDFVARPRVAGDPNLIAIVIANLLRNSFSYTECGHVLIRLDDSRLVIEDTGIGVPREALDRIFERHYRGTQSQGAGIGLALVHKICERYAWKVRLESEEGKGTRASLLFRQ